LKFPLGEGSRRKNRFTIQIARKDLNCVSYMRDFPFQGAGSGANCSQIAITHQAAHGFMVKCLAAKGDE